MCDRLRFVRSLHIMWSTTDDDDDSPANTERGPTECPLLSLYKCIFGS